MPDSCSQNKAPNATKECCCGPIHHRPSQYRTIHGLTTVETSAGSVPVVPTRLTAGDYWGRFLVRLGINRMNYAIRPGLYACGNPKSDSPVIVTANYKLTFDILRKELEGISAWILVLDSKGVNVWCAAGKGTFGTEELIQRIKATNLKRVSNTKEIILPQLGATGIAAPSVQKSTSLRVIYGPVEAKDIPRFLENKKRCGMEMRKVRFPLLSRLEISLFEFTSALKWFLIAASAMLIATSFHDNSFNLEAGWGISKLFHLTLALSLSTGTFLFALLLPWLPARPFALKGFWLGASVITIFLVFFPGLNDSVHSLIAISATILAITMSFALAFTGSSTFTSLSGVRKETRRFLPIISLLFLTGLVFWILTFSNAGGKV